MKWVLRIVGLLVVVVLVVAVVAFFMLNTIVKTAVQTAGASATGVQTDLDGVNISPFSGAATISDFRLGQPEGFDGEVLFSLSAADVQVAPGSLLGDTVQVPKVHIDGAHLTVSFANGKLNLQKLMEQIAERTGGAAEEEPADPDAPGKNVVIDDLRITNTTVSGSVALFPGQPPIEINDLKIADIEKQGIGSDGSGVKLEDALGIILETIIVNATEGIASNVPGLTDLENMVGDVAGAAGQAAEEVIGNAGDQANQVIEGAGQKIEEGIGGLLGGFGQKKEQDDAPSE
ncbi:MAG: AsmA family protein [Planctomycetota bacterium]